MSCGKRGRLTDALAAIEPRKPHGPWKVLFGGETFLRPKQSLPEYRKRGVKLWQIPARSHNLSPVKKYWSWLRRRLLSLDSANVMQKRFLLRRYRTFSVVKMWCARRCRKQRLLTLLRDFGDLALSASERKGAQFAADGLIV